MSPVLWLLLIMLDGPPAASPAATAPKSTSPQPTTATAPAPAAPASTAPATTAPMGTLPQPTGLVWPPPTRPAETQPAAPIATAPAGAIKPPKRSLEYGEILVPALWLIGALMLAAIIFSWLKRSRHQPELSPEALAHEQLAHFRKLRDEGEMTDEEYKKVMKKLQGQIQGGPPAAAPKPPPLNGKPKEPGT